MDNRLIIVLGMAHSGTRIFTKILMQSKKVKLLANGPEAHLFENDFLLHQNANGINKFLLACESPHYVLVKRPWTESYWDFYRQNFPKANYFILLKTFEDQAYSWSKPKSYIGRDLKTSKEEQRRVYDLHYKFAMQFPLPKKIIHFREMLNNPQVVFENINKQLDLETVFDVKEIEEYRRTGEKLGAIRRGQS